jgi:putative aldouronate transport system substrate-binding protein
MSKDKTKVAILLLTVLLSLQQVWAGGGADKGKPSASGSKPLEIHMVKKINTSIQYLEGESVNNNYLLNYIQNQLNVKFVFDYEFDSNSYNERINLLIASGKIPDAFICNRSQLIELHQAGMIEDITALYKANVSKNLNQAYEDSEGIAWMNAEIDGKKWALPDIECGENSLPLLYVRTDWLKKVGLGVPKTIEDVAKVALAFKNNDPDGNGKNDTMGILGQSAITNIGEAGMFSSIFYMERVYPKYWYYGPNGELLYGSVQPGVKTALANLRDLVNRGVIEKEFATFGWDPFLEAITSGKCGIFWAPWWYITIIKTMTFDDPSIIWETYFAPLDDKGIANTPYPDVSANYLVFRKGLDKNVIAACIKTVNIQWEMDQDQGVSTMPKPESPYSFGMMPFNYNVNRLYDKRIKAQEVYDTYHRKGDPSKLIGESLETYDAYKFIVENGIEKASLRQIHLYYAFMVAVLPIVQQKDKINWVKPATFQSTPTMEERWATLSKLEQETYTRIILGQKPLDEFDNFVRQWRSLGGDQIIKELNDILNTK